jgi:RNA polymerase sigma factor (sigma-70 family)
MELIARAKRGELEAYEEIVRRHGSIAFRTALVITGSAADAEEAAQDGFVKAHAALGRFREGAPLRPWLLTIVANEARNRLRSAGRRERLALRVAEERRLGGAVPSPEAALLGSEQREELLAAVGELSEPDRQVICCRYFLELSEQETAAALPGLCGGHARSFPSGAWPSGSSWTSWGRSTSPPPDWAPVTTNVKIPSQRSSMWPLAWVSSVDTA